MRYLTEKQQQDRAMASYTHYKNMWDAVKPIRGRSVEVRPIGDRRRDWEQIIKKPLPNGEFSYCARLYNTDVVEYLPNGNIILRTGGWETPSTAEFMFMHSPFTTWKASRKVWARIGKIAYPVGDALEVQYDPIKREYAPVAKVVIRKTVVDRAKAKDARAPVMPFLNWAKVFLKMSDGWIMHATRKELLKYVGPMSPLGFEYSPMYQRHRANFPNSERLYAHISNAKPDEYPRILCSLLRDTLYSVESQKAETETWEGVMMNKPHTFHASFHNMRFEYETLKEMVYDIVAQAVNITTIKEVKPTQRSMTNVL